MKRMAFALCCAFGMVGPACALEPVSKPAPAPSTTSGQASPEAPKAVAVQALTLKEFAARVARSDELVRAQRLEEYIADQGIRGAEAIYEPAFFLGVEREKVYLLNSALEAKQRQLSGGADDQVQPSDIFRSDELRYKTGLLWKAPTGADLELSYNLTSTWNSVQNDAYSTANWDANDMREYKGYLGFKLSQPLLRGYGPEVTNQGIVLAWVDRNAAHETMRQMLTQRLMEGVQTYLQAQRASERVRLRTEARDVAEEIARQLELQTVHGLRTAAEMKEAQSSLALRRVQLAQAQQELDEQLNALQNFVTAEDGQQGFAAESRSIVVGDRLDLLVGPDLLAVLAQAARNEVGPNQYTEAIDLRPETRLNAVRRERESLKIESAKDQKRPDLSLTLRYGKEDLSTSTRALQDYFNDGVPYNSWMIGLQYKHHLFGGQKGDSEYQAALLRRQQVELAQGALAQRIANEVQGSLKVLGKAMQQVERQREVVRTQRELLEIEQGMVRDGRRSSLDILKKRLDLLLAEEALADGITFANRAGFLVSQAQGRVLSRLELE